MIDKILNKVISLIEFISSLSLAIALLLVLIQVLFRYVLNSPLGFTQELSIYGMISSVLFGCVVAIKKGSHLFIEIIFTNKSSKIFYIILLISSIISIMFYLILMYQGYILAMRGMLQMSPQTGLPVGYITSLIPICSLLSMVYTVSYVTKVFKGG